MKEQCNLFQNNRTFEQRTNADTHSFVICPVHTLLAELPWNLVFKNQSQEGEPFPHSSSFLGTFYTRPQARFSSVKLQPAEGSAAIATVNVSFSSDISMLGF